MTFAIILFIIYAIMIACFSIGWIRIADNSQKHYTPTVSVLIAVRNESQNIFPLFQSLLNQNYPSFEIIIVNDHSEDDSLKKLSLLKKENPQIAVKIFELSENVFGKKAAVRLGIEKCIGDIILSTDADCTHNPNWINSMISYFYDDTDLVVGPVAFKSKNILDKLFALEFMSLVGSGAGAIGFEHPIFCNAANMAFRKNALSKLHSDLKYKHASGDDVFLLHHLKKRNKKSIRFAKSTEAIVSTLPPSGIKQFVSQRIRWAAKAKAYTDIDSIIVSMIVLLSNIALLSGILLSLFYPENTTIVITGFSIKIIADYVFLGIITRFFNQKNLLLFVIPLQLFYFLYISVTGILSIIIPFRWKGRKYYS